MIPTPSQSDHQCSSSRTPCVIAIGGPSCSGKTTLARRLVEHWGADRARAISLDRYYRDLSALSLEQRAEVNFDHPDSLDGDLLMRQICELAAGRAVELPTYDFAAHTRGETVELVQPSDFVVLEGLFTFHWSPLCDVLDIKVFLDVRNQTALDRRIHRDTRERGRTEESVREQWSRSVAPMREVYVDPTRQLADLVISGQQTIEDMQQELLTHIREELDR